MSKSVTALPRKDHNGAYKWHTNGNEADVVDTMVHELVEGVVLEEARSIAGVSLQKQRASGPASAQRRVRSLHQAQKARKAAQTQKATANEAARAQVLASERVKLQQQVEQREAQRKAEKEQRLLEQRERRKAELKKAHSRLNEPTAGRTTGPKQSKYLHKQLEQQDKHQRAQHEAMVQQQIEQAKKLKRQRNDAFLHDRRNEVAVDEAVEQLIVETEAVVEGWAKTAAVAPHKLSRFYERVVHEKERSKQEEDKQKRLKAERLLRGSSYAQSVRMSKLPPVSNEKRAEVQQRIQQSKKNKESNSKDQSNPGSSRSPANATNLPSIRELFADRREHLEHQKQLKQQQQQSPSRASGKSAGSSPPDSPRAPGTASSASSAHAVATPRKVPYARKSERNKSGHVSTNTPRTRNVKNSTSRTKERHSNDDGNNQPIDVDNLLHVLVHEALEQSTEKE